MRLDLDRLAAAEAERYADGTWIEPVGRRFGDRPCIMSPTGTIHLVGFAEHERLGGRGDLRRTRCGYWSWFGDGWGEPRRRLIVDCRRCIALAEHDRRRR